LARPLPLLRYVLQQSMELVVLLTASPRQVGVAIRAFVDLHLGHGHVLTNLNHHPTPSNSQVIANISSGTPTRKISARQVMPSAGLIAEGEGGYKSSG
jgi:hypothetical protein